MSNPIFKKNAFIIYLAKFIGIFSILYFGTIGWIGFTAPGGYYSVFADHYLNYVSWLRQSLLFGAKEVSSMAGYEVYVKGVYTLQVLNGKGVHVGFDCLGYGVLSFWAAFIIANEGTFAKKAAWVICGLVLIWCINVARIALLLIAINKKWGSLPGFDHHTWFTIAAYACIFTGIYLYDQSAKAQLKTGNARE